jgi:hypothetical protein
MSDNLYWNLATNLEKSGELRKKLGSLDMSKLGAGHVWFCFLESN